MSPASIAPLAPTTGGAVAGPSFDAALHTAFYAVRIQPPGAGGHGFGQWLLDSVNLVAAGSRSLTQPPARAANPAPAQTVPTTGAPVDALGVLRATYNYAVLTALMTRTVNQVGTGANTLIRGQ